MIQVHSGNTFDVEYRSLNCKADSFRRTNDSPRRENMLIHGLVNGSRANGPGLRAVVYFQGCTVGCRFCWNKETHAFSGEERSVVT